MLYEVITIPIHYIYYFLGLAYLDDGIYEDALVNFLKSAEINPFFAKGIFKVSECYRSTKELDRLDDDDSITSYNVCYTKLLRLKKYILLIIQ